MQISQLFKQPRVENKKEYLAKKIEDHRMLTAALYVLGAITAIALWGWDYVIDPIGARETIGLRFLYLATLSGTLIFRKIRNRTILKLTYPIEVFYCMFVFSIIINRLETGTTYGINGYMMFMIWSLVLGLGFSTRVNHLSTLATALFPHLIALSGIVKGFQHKYYAIIMWPTAFIIIIIQLVLSNSYRIRYNTEKQLITMSTKDSLTGSYNRRYFMDQLEKEIIRSKRYKEPFCLMMFDIDHFKSVNDKYGHLTGDIALRSVSDLIHSSIRTSDLYARYGGEEFIVMLPATKVDGAFQIAQRIRKLIESEVFIGENQQEFKLTISIGVYEYSMDDLTVESMIGCVDQMLYKAKTSGRNKVVAYPKKTS